MLLTGLIAVAVFWPTVHYGLLDWDDTFHLTNNPFLQPDSASRYIHFWREPYGNLYIPVTYNIWAWLYPGSHFHLASVLVHAACTALVFWLISGLLLLGPAGIKSDSRPRPHILMAAFLGAVFFAVHPLQVESVAWVSEFRGLLATLFSLASVIAYLHATRADPVRRVSYTAGVLFFALALLSKPSAIALPAVIAVLDMLILRKVPMRSLRQLVPWLALATLLGAITSLLQVGARTSVPIVLRPLVAGDALAFYLTKLVWPFSLCSDYSRTPEIARQGVWFWIAWIVPSAVLAASVFWATSRRNRAGLGLVLLFTAALLPVLGLSGFDFQRISTVGDRYVYLAMLAPAFGISIIVGRASGRWRKFLITVALATLGLLIWRSENQLRSWESDRTLWVHATAVNPKAVIATSNLAEQAATAGDRTAAEMGFDRVIALAPGRANGYIGRAKILRDAGEPASAEMWYRKAIAADLTDPVALNDLGSMLANQPERRTEAESLIRRSVEVDRRYADGWNNLGAVLLEKGAGHETEAIAAFDRALRLHPRLVNAHIGMALAFQQMGQGQKGVPFMLVAARLSPADERPLRFLVRRAAEKQDWQQCLQLLSARLQAEPSNIWALNELGQLYVATDRLDDAIATFELAVHQRPDLPALRDNLATARKLKISPSTKP